VSAAAAASDCGLVQCDPTFHDPQHVIVFDDTTWPHNDPNSTLALTTVTYGVDTGTIFDADTEVNTAHWTITAQEPPPAGAYSLQAILTHEAGHFLGLAHATTTTPIMYAQYQPDAVTLTQDDVDGVCSIYPPGPANSPPGNPGSSGNPKSGCACVAGAAAPGPWSVGAGVALLGLLIAHRARRPRAPGGASGALG
jgi:MYXO-CTERM domain-containing protein